MTMRTRSAFEDRGHRWQLSSLAVDRPGERSQAFVVAACGLCGTVRSQQFDPARGEFVMNLIGECQRWPSESRAQEGAPPQIY